MAAQVKTTVPEAVEVSDGQLLAEVAATQTAHCFEELVRRHGPMVLATCRRILRDTHEAEDAAQAVFLLLWTKAASLRRRACVAGWLFHAARNICRNAQRAIDVRRRREKEAAQMKSPEPAEAGLALESSGVLDEALNGLSEKYRLPVILFHLEGRSIEEVAALLGTNVSTIGTRLSRAREKLRSRLARSGLSVSGAVLAASLTSNAGASEIPAAFASNTTRAAELFAAGKLVGDGIHSAALATEVIGMVAKVKATLSLAAAFAVAATIAIGLYCYATGLTEEQMSEIERLQGTWVVVAVEEAGEQIPEEQFRAVNSRAIFDGTRLYRRQTTPDGKDVGEELSFAVDPTRSPKTIDVSQQGKTRRGIYQLEGDTLAICIDRAGGRPSDFTTRPNTRQRLEVFGRAKPAGASNE